MLRRIVSLVLLAWLFGFLWFALALPQPAAATRTDAVVVLTGGTGRVTRGVDVLHAGRAKRLFVSGVDRTVRPQEFAVEYKVKSIRLVTNDWHMRRAEYELERVLPADVSVLPDAVPSQPSLRTLFTEYHKLLARRVSELTS